MKKTFVLRPEDSAFYVLASMVALCKSLYIGTFSDLDAAVKARDMAASSKEIGGVCG